MTVVVVVSAHGGAAQQPTPAATMSFFVTSVGRGLGANLGGLAGADAHCQALAERVGHGSKEWRAYLSAPSGSTARPSAGSAPVHARDRIGRGPWTNAAGVVIAASLDELHGEGNGIDRETALSEKGTRIGEGRHDILTGSNPDGTLATGPDDTTCRGWTSLADGRAMVGHHNRSGGGQRSTSWNSAHLSRGCSQRQLRASMGDGLIYCFAE